MQVQVASYNIHHGEGTDKRFDVAGIADVIRSSSADIIGLQEVDMCTQRCGGVDQAAEVAGHLGFHKVFASYFPFQGGEYGNAILSRFPIVKSHSYLLPTGEGCEPRTLVQATLNVGGTAVDIYNTHLEVRNEAVREEQCSFVATILRSCQLPVILMGDMNAKPGEWDHESQIRSLMWDTDAESNSPTYPSGKPRKRIDYILCSSHWTSQGNLSVEHVDSPRSDHQLICARLELIKKE